MSEQPIDADKGTLGGLLKAGRLRVPDFQREYSWKPPRVRKLFDDINNAMTIKRLPTYFLGMITVTPGQPPAVIDGQQRLATISIFLAAVRDKLLEIGKEEDARSIETDFLFEWDRSVKERLPRLTLNTDDREYMKARVLDPPSERTRAPVARLHSHRLIDAAAQLSADRVNQIVASADTLARKVEALDAWTEYIHHNAIVVLLTAPSANRAYQMYKTMNDRAQRTTPADIIKSHLFEQAGDRSDEAQSKWSTMRATIEGISAGGGGDDPLLTYLHHASIAFNGPVQEEDIFDVIEDNIVGRASALKFLESLATFANAYAAIVTPSHANWAKHDTRVRTYVKNISQEIKMTFIRPLMLAVAAKFSATETNRAFRLFVSWVVRFLVSGGSRSGVVEKAIGESALAVKEGRIKTAKDLAKKILHVIPNDMRFRAAFSTKSMSSGRQARFILRELEAERRGGHSDALLAPIEDTSQLTLEHILPKNLAAKEGWEHFSDDERKAYCKRLGNLVLLNARDNGAIGDKPFAIKRPAIEQSKNIYLTADVICRTTATSKWMAKDISDRQAMLADLAIKRWPFDVR